MSFVKYIIVSTLFMTTLIWEFASMFRKIKKTLSFVREDKAVSILGFIFAIPLYIALRKQVSILKKKFKK